MSIQGPDLIQQQATTLRENEKLRRENDRLKAELAALRDGINRMKLVAGMKVKEPLQ